jgi:archaellin
MNHKNTTLAIAAIVAAVAITAVAFAIPQQALAGGHHNHSHNSNSIKVSQDIGQTNVCSNATVCLNTANNSADIHR